MMAINLFLDGLFFGKAGIGRYYSFLIKELARRREVDLIYTTIISSKKKEFEKEMSSFSTVKPVYVDYGFFTVREFFSKSAILRDLEKKIDVFHFPQVNLPLYIPPRCIATVPDVQPLKRKNYFKKEAFRFYLKRALNNCDELITISNFSKNALAKTWPEYKDKLNMIYLALDEKFGEIPSTGRFLEERYILFVGSRKKHKNLGRLVRGFGILKKKYPELKLVIAGAKFKRRDEVDIWKERLGLQGEIIEFISPSDEELLALYWDAEALVFPSLYEGFGLPPLEAMACEIPAIVSDIPPLREVCRDGAYYINSRDKNEIARGVDEVLNNPLLADRLKEAGMKRVRFFSSQRVVEEHLVLYRRVMSK